MCAHVYVCWYIHEFTCVEISFKFTPWELRILFFCFNFKISFVYYLCLFILCVCVSQLYHVQELRTTCGSWCSLFYPVCSRDQTRVVGLGGQRLYLLGYLYLIDIFVLFCEQGSVTET